MSRGLLALLVVGWAGVAGAVEADQLSTDRSEATPVWIVAGAVNHQRDPLTRDCQWVPATPHSALPEGLRTLAHVVTAECGATFVFLDLPTEIYREQRASVAWTTLDGVSLEPPAGDPWADAPVIREAYLHSYRNDGYSRVAPISDPDWVEPLRLGPGEPVEVLDEELAVVRTASGHSAVISPWWLSDRDPLVSSADLRPYGELRRRFAAGRGIHEREHTLIYLPAAEVLVESTEAQRGRAYELQIDPAWLGEEQFQADWLDPVGQVLDHACDERRRDGEPCGAYYLDYSAFGAWWPRGALRVVALADGIQEVDGRTLPVLRVVVREPWTRKLEVSPAWDRP